MQEYENYTLSYKQTRLYTLLCIKYNFDKNKDDFKKASVCRLSSLEQIGIA